jgi:hypothetical protein
MFFQNPIPAQNPTIPSPFQAHRSFAVTPKINNFIINQLVITLACPLHLFSLALVNAAGGALTTGS